MKNNSLNQGQSLIGIIIVLVIVGLFAGGLYYYFSKQIPEMPEIVERLTEEEVVKPEEVIPPPEEELPLIELSLAELPVVIFDDGNFSNPHTNTPDIGKISRLFYQKYADVYDFLIIFTTTPSELLRYHGGHTGLQGDIQGIGVADIWKDITQLYGSKGRLLGTSFAGSVGVIYNSHFLTVNTVDKVPHYVYSLIFHELVHQWAVYIGCEHDEVCSLPIQSEEQPNHWSIGLHSPHETDTILGRARKWIDNGDGTFTLMSPWIQHHYFPRLHPLDFYLMGLKDANELPNTFFVVRPDGGYADFDFAFDRIVDNEPVTIRGTKFSFSVQDIIAVYGERIPNAANSQKDFSLAIILLESANYPATQEMKGMLRTIAQNLPGIWNWLTEGRSTINFPTLRR